jgi:hypothetical protein
MKNLSKSYNSYSVLPPIVHDREKPNAPNEMLKILVKKAKKKKKKPKNYLEPHFILEID